MKITPKSGASLHRVLLKSVLRAPQSFFDTTDSGITLNRFSQDMTLIDGPLPSAAVMSMLSQLSPLLPRNIRTKIIRYNAKSRPVGFGCSRINLHGHHMPLFDFCTIPPTKFLSPYVSTNTILRFGVQKSTIHTFRRDSGRPFHNQGIWVGTPIR